MRTGMGLFQKALLIRFFGNDKARMMFVVAKGYRG